MPERAAVMAMPEKIAIAFASCSSFAPPWPMNEPTTPPILLAAATNRNQAPIIKDAIRRGANLVTIDKPIGDKQSSPIVWKK